MRHQEEWKGYDEMLDFLDKFFHRKLRRAKLYDELQYLKKELKQQASVAVLMKLKKEKYNDYSLTTLTKIKARDIWVEFCKSRFKNPISTKPAEELAEEISIIIVPGIEIKDELRDIQKSADVISFQMLKLHAEGYTYKEIAHQFRTTEDAVKMKIFRLRNDLNP
jgi:hypothetical protein